MLRVQEVHAGLIFGWLSAQLLRLSALTLVVGDHDRVAPLFLLSSDKVGMFHDAAHTAVIADARSSCLGGLSVLMHPKLNHKSFQLQGDCQCPARPPGAKDC